MLARHPSNKRHTKPCKFFQTSRCPLSAQECDFAHVLFEEVVPQRQNTICRYYLAGNCGSGPKCKYRHGIEHTEERKAMTDTMGIDPPYSRSPSSVIPPLHTAYHTVYPVPPSAWVPYGDAYSPPVYTPDAVPVRPFFKPSLVSASYSGHSSNSASTSARSSLSEDVEFVTEDPKYSEHSHEHQSQIRIAEKRPVVHVSPFYSSKNGHGSVSPVSPVIVNGPSAAAHSNVHPSHISNSPIFPPSAPRVRSRSNSRYKTSNYKTKVCKYFSSDGHCPNGNECTFIHEEPVPKITSSTTQSLKPPPGLPPKPISQLEENHKRNYFPVSWRVIGGGVLIGDPTHASVSQEVGPPEWTESTNGECMDKQSDVYPGQIDTNSASPPSAAGYRSAKPARRPRSTSIPSSSRPAQVKMMKSLFPAESPGSL